MTRHLGCRTQIGRLTSTPARDRFPYKKIRAAHAKEKQQIRKTCNYPNRLNLLFLTGAAAQRSKNFNDFRVFLGVSRFGQDRSVRAVKLSLHGRGGASRLHPALPVAAI